MYENPIARNIEREIGSLRAFDLPIAGDPIYYRDFLKDNESMMRTSGSMELSSFVHFYPVKRRSRMRIEGLHRSIISSKYHPAKMITQSVRNALRAMIQWCEANGKDMHEVWEMEVCYESLPRVIEPFSDLLFNKDTYYEVEYLLGEIQFDQQSVALYLPYFDMNYGFTTAYDCILGGIEYFSNFLTGYLDFLREEYTDRLESMTLEELKVIDTVGFKKLLDVYRNDDSEGKVLDLKAVEKWLKEYEEMINSIPEDMNCNIFLFSTEPPYIVIEKREDIDFYVRYFCKFSELEEMLPNSAVFDDESWSDDFGAIELMKDILRVYQASAGENGDGGK